MSSIATFTAPEVNIYQIPPNVLRGAPIRAESWPQPPFFSGKIVIYESTSDHSPTCSIKVLDKNTGDLFAECPFTSTSYVNTVVDSSRYFVVRFQNGKEYAWLGVGFPDRDNAYVMQFFYNISILPCIQY